VAPVPAALAGERVDRVVATLTGLSRRVVADLVGAGAVRLAGVAVAAGSHRVATDEILEVALPPPSSPAVAPDPTVAVPLVHVDDQVIVVDKPAGLVVHPGAGHDRGTMVHGLLARFPELASLGGGPGEGGGERPGIVHRLDRLTSGLLVVARTPEARTALVAQLARRSVERRYLALVWGAPTAEVGVVEAPVGRAEGDPTRMAVVAGGRQARTHYEVRARFARPAEVTLLECRLETGRTHQVRVHLSAIGHPVVGDPQYGRRRGRPQPTWPGGPLERPFLHAHRLAFDHPGTGERRSFTSPLPPELAAVLEGLE
jgi:23S rRNA pseudouridine1911/1915/1917 synthase